MSFDRDSLTRRRFVATATLATAGIALGAFERSRAADSSALIRKTIPSTGEELTVVGLGTNNYSVESVEELAKRRRVIERFTELGGEVLDTAPAYGRSESVVGELVHEVGNRKGIFLATKVTAQEGDVAQARLTIEESFRHLRTDRIDLLQVHNLTGAEALLPVLVELKQDRRIRYFGITTSREEQYAAMLELMSTYPMDFIQVDYSIANQSAADRILPLAAAKGIAVLVNMPFGGRRDGNLFPLLEGRELPAWASEIGVASWAQFLLKYVVSHPAVTCAIPGTHRIEHIEDNLAAARGTLPDRELRERMADYVSSDSRNSRSRAR